MAPRALVARNGGWSDLDAADELYASDRRGTVRVQILRRDERSRRYSLACWIVAFLVALSAGVYVLMCTSLVDVSLKRQIRVVLETERAEHWGARLREQCRGQQGLQNQGTNRRG